MDSTTHLGLSLAEIAGIIFTLGGSFVTVVSAAIMLTFKFSGKFTSERQQTEADVKLARTDLGNEIINRCRDLKAEFEKENDTLSGKVKEDHGTLSATVAKIQNDVLALPEKWRGELDKRFEPVNKGVEDLKNMFTAMERDNRDRFMDARDIKENRKEDQTQIAGLAVRVVNAESAAKAVQTDITGVMANMASLSSGLNQILRKLEGDRK